ncbi:helix-turn-helix transcriptional regulator [Lipingzhangella sp. LS1_29]|uniref:Helix-turn-helix transcriptional regulator n=2 Tax=Lipingzhangella rawalii TaxID=2055835 RepID=A0ABU2H6J9_9ACTN|nr:helix-turn-helix transcriptional regulator [Lipingzhangella rawalii]
MKDRIVFMALDQWVKYGEELRRLREQAGMTQRQLADRVGLSHAMIGAIERAIRKPTPDYSDHFDAALETGGTLRRHWKDAHLRRDVPEWFRDALALESQAVEIREFESLVVPGILQNHEYATHLESTLRQRPDPEAVAKDAETRTARLPELVSRGALVKVVIPERVLRHQMHSPGLMQRQLGYMSQRIEAAACTVQVLTEAPCLETVFPFRIILLNDHIVAYAEGAGGGVLINHPDQVNRLVERFVRLQSEALPPAHSLRLIKKLEDNYAAAVDD